MVIRGERFWHGTGRGMMNIPLPMMVVALAGWVNEQPLAVIEYLKEENQVLGEQLGRKRLRFTDAQRGDGINTKKAPLPGVSQGRLGGKNGQDFAIRRARTAR